MPAVGDMPLWASAAASPGQPYHPANISGRCAIGQGAPEQAASPPPRRQIGAPPQRPAPGHPMQIPAGQQRHTEIISSLEESAQLMFVVSLLHVPLDNPALF